MLVKVTSKRQVTFPARVLERVLEAMGVQPGDRLRLEEGPDGFVLRPQTIDPARLAPLRDKLRRGRGSFNLTAFREQRHDPALRD